MTEANQNTNGYRNFRPLHGRLPAPANYCIRRKKELTDYPLWWIKPARYVIQLFGGENVTFIQTRAQLLDVRIYFIDKIIQ